MHRDVFDQTCQNCHTTEDPGGVSNQSFCSNIACHGNVYDYAGFDAPSLRAIIAAQVPVSTDMEDDNETPANGMEETDIASDATTPEELDIVSTPEPIATEQVITENPTFDNAIGQIFQSRCGDCHKPGGLAGLDLTTYEGVMAGATSGPVIVINDADGSRLVQIQSGDQPHFGRLSPEELAQVFYWIDHGALEK